MAPKLLAKASLAAGFTVLSEDGFLRLEDAPKPCLGYQFGCVCESCRARAEGKTAAPKCECDTPMPSEDTCGKCGKPLPESSRPAA